MAIEEPKFEILQIDGNIEIRRYQPKLVAEVLVDGDLSKASNKGFRQIAAFIFGNNHAGRTDDLNSTTRISMVAPVVIEPQAQSLSTSEKITMTAPVMVTPQTEAAAAMHSANTWLVSFVMPSKYTLATLPLPNDAAINIREIPGTTMAVLRYSWFNGIDRVQAKTEELNRWLSANHYAALGSAQLARYNPPWTLPMLRRNEIMIAVSYPAS
jgi:hypothetical protein